MEKIIEILKNSNNIAILPHVKPDGDALGSALALNLALKALGKTSFVEVEEEGITPKYATIASSYEEMPSGFVPELVVSVDVAERKMLGERGERYQNIDVCIDHHPSNPAFGVVNLINVKAAATGEIIFDIVEKLGVEITEEMAKCLYVSITTDTGCFKFSNTTDRTFEIAAKLYKVYGNFSDINYEYFTVKKRSQIEAEKLVMNTLEFFADGKIATVTITHEMREQTGAMEDDTDYFAQIPRRIEGVEVGITYKECEKAGWRISMRSNQSVDVSAVCQTFGGGGHNRAAGASINKPLDEVKKEIITEVLKWME